MDPSRPKSPAASPERGKTVVPVPPAKTAASAGKTQSTPGATQINPPAKPGATPGAPRPKAAPTVANMGATSVPNPKATARNGGTPDATAADTGEYSDAAEDFEATHLESQGARPKAAPAVAGTKVSQLGDFKVLKKLGEGGMGVVYLAHQVSLDRDVALKVMAKQFSSQESFVKRFKREAQTMAKLDHPNIVRGYAVGEDQGLLYLAMELVNGKSMHKWMQQLGKLSLGDAVHVTLQVADALRHAHELNLIHRDIKPDNILITEKGIVKVSDMGLAKAVDEDMSMTQSGTGLGTPYYMPPEQARDAKHVDHRSDIYALGCTLYHFLSGKLPFAGASATELILSKEKGTFTRVRSLNSQIPERLDLIIDKMLAKEPKYRYQSCAELIRDLEGLGLAHDSPSFIDTGLPSGGAVRTARPAGTLAATKANTAVPAGKTTVAPQDETAWYVYQPGPDGKPKKVKMSIGQIKALLKTGKLDVKSKASTTPNGSFVPLASYREFENIVQTRLIKQDADKKAEQYQQLYKKIDRQARWYPFWKWLRRMADDVKGIISLIVYLAVIVGLVYGLFAYGPTLMQLIKAKTGSG
jgi:eukaryotic-like serine/threonine-protein kinase